MNQKYGILRSWYEDRGFGIVWVSRAERYLLHITRILEPDVPVAGYGVLFDAAEPFKMGALPLAVNARIVLPRTVQINDVVVAESSQNPDVAKKDENANGGGR